MATGHVIKIETVAENRHVAWWTFRTIFCWWYMIWNPWNIPDGYSEAIMRQAKPNSIPSLVGYKNNAGTVHLETMYWVKIHCSWWLSHDIDTTLNDTHILGREGLYHWLYLAQHLLSDLPRTQTWPNEAMYHEALCPKHYVSVYVLGSRSLCMNVHVKTFVTIHHQ